MSFKSFAIIAVCCLVTTDADCAEGETISGIDRAFFENKIRPVLVQRCYECHSVESKEVGGSLLLDSAGGLKKGGQSGAAVVPGKPDESLLIAALKYDGVEMPPTEPLAPAVVANFVKWVRDGAKYPASEKSDAAAQVKKWDGAAVWSFHPRTNPAVPEVNTRDWPRDPIDNFVLARIEAADIAPVSDASADVLIRRLSYDLIGLPPTIQQVADFRKAYETARESAVERLVDSLLASPQFGERWGRHWLDVARYGESNGDDGLGRNATFPYAWRYRDYVIDAFNADVPYDRFLTEQIAGDLLPAKNAEQRNRQLIATGFLAIGSKPAAAMNKDFPMDVVDNQINVISTGVMGLSVACARCHDHKHDPIPTRDYYAMAGIFTSTQTLYGNAGNEKLTAPPTPLHELVSEWNPNVSPKQASANGVLALSQAYHSSVQKSKPTIYASLTEAPKTLESMVAKFDKQNFARVNNSSIHGQLPTSAKAYSVSFWFRNDMPNNKRPITAYLFSRAKRGDAGLPGDHIGIGGTHDSSRTGKLFVFNGNEKKQSLPGSVVIKPGSWNHIMLSRDGEQVRVFLNGNLEIEGELSATYGDSPDFSVAIRSDKFAPLQGNVADFAIWERAFAADEAVALFDASGRPRGRRSPGVAMGVRDKKKLANCKIHISGTSAKLGAEVPRGFLSAYATVQKSDRMNAAIPGKNSGRRELARWLTNPDHPQTARVMVNRIWLHLFGRGIVSTPDDFGVYGARPTNPELLDHLAVRFINDGWSIKKLIRTIVLTRTYQLDSACGPKLAARDPDNELFARHSRRRLDAESIRDSVLAASGELNLDRPVGSDVHKIDQLINWPPGEATNLHKPCNHRSIYLCMLRHDPPKELVAFDLPDGIADAGRRAETSSPTQSLFLLNNPFVVGQAKLLSQSIRDDNNGSQACVIAAFRRILRREPTPEESERAIEYLGKLNAERLASLCQALFVANEFRYVD